MTHIAHHKQLTTPPRMWPTLHERLAWAMRETSELHDWRKAAAEAALPTVTSLFVLRHVLDPQSWKAEAVIAAVSLAAGLFVVPAIRFAVNFLWRAPRRIVEERLAITWHEYIELKAERDLLLSEKIEVEIGGIFARRAGFPGATPESDGTVYALQNTIITNRSDASVSLSFELWLPWTNQTGAWLMIREQEHSGLGRGDLRYARSPINIGPRASSECRDIGFLCLPGDSILFGEQAVCDLKRAVLRVIDRVSRKTIDVPVRRRAPFSKPPREAGESVSDP